LGGGGSIDGMGVAVSCLVDPEPRVREVAVQLLGLVGSPGEAVEDKALCAVGPAHLAAEEEERRVVLHQLWFGMHV
jgi:hypothetical protein